MPNYEIQVVTIPYTLELRQKHRAHTYTVLKMILENSVLPQILLTLIEH